MPFVGNTVLQLTTKKSFCFEVTHCVPSQTAVQRYQYMSVYVDVFSFGRILLVVCSVSGDVIIVCTEFGPRRSQDLNP